jgi:hypothetical protein
MSLYKADVVRAHPAAQYGVSHSVIEHAEFVLGLHTQRVYMNPVMVIYLGDQMESGWLTLMCLVLLVAMFVLRVLSKTSK